MRKGILFTILFFLCFAVCNGQPAFLDSTFGTSGIVSTDFFGGTDQPFSMKIQNDGKIVVAGFGTDSAQNLGFALARYNIDGTLDNSFGMNGKVISRFSFGSDASFALALQYDGKIICGGYIFGGISRYDFGLARYNTNGSLDTLFGTGGKVITAVGLYDDRIYSLDIQPDGKIVAAGFTYQTSSTFSKDFAVARYNSDGSLDSAFGNSGLVITDIGTSISEGRSLKIQPDGKIILTGYSNYPFPHFATARYNINGGLDTTFGNGGMVLTSSGGTYDQARAVEVQPDGKIVVTGEGYVSSSSGFLTCRYNSDGSLDSTYGSGGMTLTNIGSYTDISYSISIDTTGKIIVAGETIVNGNGDKDFAVIRYKTNGFLDSSFGNNGIIITDLHSSSDMGRASAIQNDGKIVVAGMTDNGNDADFGLVRYSNSFVGISESIFKNSALIISPNPFSTHLSVNSTTNAHYSITLFSYTGKEILHQRTFTGEAVLNTESLAAGLYFLKVDDGKEVRNYKVVKAN